MRRSLLVPAAAAISMVLLAMLFLLLRRRVLRPKSLAKLLLSPRVIPAPSMRRKKRAAHRAESLPLRRDCSSEC